MKTIKQISLSLLLVSTVAISNSQQDNTLDSQKSIVVMSEDDIITLTNTIRAFKNKKALKQNINIETQNNETHRLSQKTSDFELEYLKNELTQLEKQLISQRNRNNYDRQSTNTSSLETRNLRNLEYEIAQLKLALQQRSVNPKNEVVILPAINTRNVVTQPKEVIISEQIPINSSSDLVINQKLDSLYSVLINTKQVENPNYTNDFEAMQKRLQELRSEMATKNAQPTTYGVLFSKYKNYKREVYFADNSKVLNTEASQSVNELHTILDANENLDVVVKGFASNKGNAVYNENLSMQRTESVKKALILRGVHPTRVLTQYHGIDYSTQNPADARRVEISILVRK